MKILIADDNNAVRASLKMVVRNVFEDVASIADPTLIPAILSGGEVDAVLLDMNFDSYRLDGSDGLFWLKTIKSHPSSPAVVLITAFGDIDLAVEAMKQGADDFVTKPWDNDDLVGKIKNAIMKNRRRKSQNNSLDRADTILRREEERDNMTLEEVRRAHVKATIERCGGNLSAAAEKLGINRQTLYNILKRNQE